MRKWISVLLPLALAGSAGAQGIVTFNTSSASGRGIKYAFYSDPLVPTNVAVGNPASIPGFGVVNIASYAASPGTVLNLDASGIPVFDSKWHLSGGIAHQIAPFPGSVPTISMTTDAALGIGGPTFFVQFIIVGWTGPYTDFNAAYQAGNSGQISMVGWSGSQFNGGALSWNQNAGSALQPGALVVGPGGFNGLVLVDLAPEPGTSVLIGLGAALLLLVRKREKLKN